VTQSLRDLDRAFGNFFAKRARYPRFKKRRTAQAVRYQLDPRQSDTWLAGERLVLPKLGDLKRAWSRVPVGRPLMVTVRRDTIGRYFVSFAIEEVIAPLPELPTTAAVGIDVGLRSAVALSDGTKVAAPRHLRLALRTVGRRARVVARRKKGSRRWERARFRLAKAHAHVSDSRKDWIHKLTTRLVRENQTLVVEDLNVRGMIRNRRLSLSLSDAALRSRTGNSSIRPNGTVARLSAWTASFRVPRGARRAALYARRCRCRRGNGRAWSAGHTTTAT